MRVTVWVGSAVLAATATFHATGYGEVRAAAAAADLPGWIGGAVGGLWLFATMHWLFIAALTVLAASYESRLTGLVLGLSAVVLIADIVLLLVHVGPFIGEVLLAISALAYAIGAIWSGSSPGVRA